MKDQGYYPDISTSDGSLRPIVVAIAVCLAESGGVPNVYLCNPSDVDGHYPPVSCPSGTTSVDRGLWQINNYYYSNVSNACAFQVQCNADAAYSISGKGTDWTPWSTYENGSWESYVSTANSEVDNGFAVTLENQGTGTCLNASKSRTGDGGVIQQWSCGSGNAEDLWN